MGIFRRWEEFVGRNEGVVLKNSVTQLSVRFWVGFKLWRVFGPVTPAKIPKTWVFMGGCYNSGTTILREIIGAHPEVAALPREGVELTSVFPDIESGGWQRMWCRNVELTDVSKKSPREVALRAQKDWAIWWKRGATVYLEKSIAHGVWMPFLEAGFDNTRFIGVIRNGYCASEGIRRRAKPTGDALDVLDRSHYTITDTAEQWVASNKKLLESKTELGAYFEVRYEDLVSDPVSVIGDVFDFIGLEQQEITLESGGVVIVGGRRFQIRDDNPSSMSRLSDKDKTDFDCVAGEMMQKLGYGERS